MVTHLTLVDSLNSLNSCSLSTNIRSIHIILHHECLAFTNGDWTALRTLSTLPLLNSLRLLLYNMLNPPGNTSCEVIAETALTVADFGFYFRDVIIIVMLKLIMTWIWFIRNTLYSLNVYEIALLVYH